MNPHFYVALGLYGGCRLWRWLYPKKTTLFYLNKFGSNLVLFVMLVCILIWLVPVPPSSTASVFTKDWGITLVFIPLCGVCIYRAFCNFSRSLEVFISGVKKVNS